jgi:large subunit ribosomal protein L4
MESVIYNQKGEQTGKIALPETVFALPWNSDLVHQVVVSLMSNMRNAIAHTKTRGDVSGGGKKPWQQKGTVRARHGSIRSPLWPGGGITHGPRNDKNYGRKVNKKMKTKALYTILSRKMKDGEILFLDNVSVADGKTKNAREMLTALGGIKGFETLANKKNNAALIALGQKDSAVERGFNNFGNVEIDEVRNLNPLDVMKYKYLLICQPEASVKFIESKMSSKTKV